MVAGRSPPSVLCSIRLSGDNALHTHLRISPARFIHTHALVVSSLVHGSGLVSVPDIALGSMRSVWEELPPFGKLLTRHRYLLLLFIINNLP